HLVPEALLRVDGLVGEVPHDLPQVLAGGRRRFRHTASIGADPWPNPDYLSYTATWPWRGELVVEDAMSLISLIRRFAFLAVLALCTCAPVQEEQSQATAALGSCDWDPHFGLQWCFQGDWWMEFSVHDATVASMDVEISDSTDTYDLEKND